MLLGWLGFALTAAATAPAVVLLARPGHHTPGGGTGVVGWLAVVLVVTAALPLAPRFALLAWRIAFLGVLVSPLIPGQSRADGGFYAILAIVFAVAGVRYGPRYTWWMWALSLIPVWLWTGPDWVYPAVNTGWLALLAAAVHATAYWRRDRRALSAQTARAEQQAARAEEQRERAERQRERNAVLTERARIAREMHDVVAHHMSMIAVQAETAPYRLAGAAGGDGGVDGLPEPVAAEFAALSGAAREALTEMRRLLGVLRSDAVANNSKKQGGGADLAPQPRLEDVPALVDAACRAGAAVTLSMSDTRPVPVRPGVGLAVYRIVQESLTNAARHAPGARISVVIAAEATSIRVSVTNEPPAGPHPEADGAGHGLPGMRERVALLGGELSAGPEPGGGFAVRALLPAGDSA